MKKRGSNSKRSRIPNHPVSEQSSTLISGHSVASPPQASGKEAVGESVSASDVMRTENFEDGRLEDAKLVGQLRLPTLAAIVLLVLSTLAAYLPSIQAEFLPFDDQEYVYLNPNVANGFSLNTLHWAFTKVSVSNWHPLTWLSHTLDAELFDLNPTGHHAMSVLWHLANVVLLFLVVKQLTGHAVPSLCLAALFALHPTHVEVVGWVAQRKTLVNTFLTLLVFATYAIYVRKQSWRWYVASLVLFALSLMAKQTFVTMPLLLILLDFWPLRRGIDTINSNNYWFELFRKAIIQLPDKLPYGVLAAIAAIITILAQTDAMQTLDSFPVADRLGNVFIAYCRYLAGIFWPSPLSIYYTIHLEKINTWTVATSAIVVVAISLISLLVSRRYPYVLTGWFWFLISMLPVIGIVHVGSQSMADRYLYNASFGIFLVVVWLGWQLSLAFSSGLGNLSGNRQRRVEIVFLTVCMIVSSCLAVATFRRCQKWQTVLGTFHEALEQDPTNWLAHRILAEKYIELREYDKAVQHARAALQEYEDSGFYVLQAIACREMDDRPQALQLLNRAIVLNPDDALAYSLLAIVNSEMGRSQEVQQMLEQAERKAELSKNRAYRRVPSLILRNCGIALLSENRPEEALARFEAAREWDSRDVGLIHEAAEAELKLGRPEKAIERLTEAQSRQPGNPATIGLLGKAYKQAGRLELAETTLRRSLELEPTNTMSALQLADMLLRSGRADDARQIIEQSRREMVTRKSSKEKNRWLGELNSQLGDVHLAQKNLAAALAAYREALGNWPDQFSANNNLAWLLATETDQAIRNPAEAVRLAEHAMGLPGAKQKGSLGTLAAAYAAAGRMEDAVRSALDALAIAEAQGDSAAVGQLRRQLELHQKGQAIFESVLTPPPQSP